MSNIAKKEIYDAKLGVWYEQCGSLGNLYIKHTQGFINDTYIYSSHISHQRQQLLLAGQRCWRSFPEVCDSDNETIWGRRHH